MKLRVGCVPFINALPLIQGLASEADLRFEVPSVLQGWVNENEVDVALISSIEALRFPNRYCVRGIGIGSDGPAASVRIFSKVPAKSIRSLALDPSSMTSNVLARILLHECYGVNPKTITSSLRPDDVVHHVDAVLLIGDAGLAPPIQSDYIIDLGADWTEFTGLPFIWALWISARPLAPNQVEVLRAAAKRGQATIDKSVRDAAERMLLDQELVKTYLKQTMQYEFDERFEQGLETFGQLIQAHGLIERAQPISWI